MITVHPLSRVAVLAGGLSLLLALWGPPVASARAAMSAISISPMGTSDSYFKLSLPAGATQELAVMLANKGDAPTSSDTYAADAYSIVNGGFGARSGSDPATGATTWLSYAA